MQDGAVGVVTHPQMDISQTEAASQAGNRGSSRTISSVNQDQAAMLGV